MSFELPPYEVLAVPVQPESAMSFWSWKAALPYSEVKRMAEGARERAFYVTGLAERDAVQAIKDALALTLRNGTGLRDFKEQCRDIITSQGWRDHRIETIFRNNMQTAYAAGRYVKMQEAKGYRPYWQYYTVGDERVRPSHAVLNKEVREADDPFWATNYPPNGHKCRCGVRTLSRRQLVKEGLTVSHGPVGDRMYTDPKTDMEYHVAMPGADDGWRSNPGKSWLDGLDLKKYEDITPKTYAEQRPQTQSNLAPVKNFPQLSEQLKTHCGRFLRNSEGFTEIVKNQCSYFMATDCRGKLLMSAKPYRAKQGVFHPINTLSTAWNKIATGKPLEWLEEYSVEVLWHEIIHNRQVRSFTGKGYRNKVMEVTTQWTARRTYHDFLQALGGKAMHQTSIKAEGLGYGYYVSNFDKLLRALKVDEAKILEGALRIIDNEQQGEYYDAMARLLADVSGKKSGISTALQRLDWSEKRYEELLRDLKLGD